MAPVYTAVVTARTTLLCKAMHRGTVDPHTKALAARVVPGTDTLVGVHLAARVHVELTGRQVNVESLEPLLLRILSSLREIHGALESGPITGFPESMDRMPTLELLLPAHRHRMLMRPDMARERRRCATSICPPSRASQDDAFGGTGLWRATDTACCHESKYLWMVTMAAMRPGQLRYDRFEG